MVRQVLLDAREQCLWVIEHEIEPPPEHRTEALGEIALDGWHTAAHQVHPQPRFGGRLDLRVDHLAALAGQVIRVVRAGRPAGQ